MLIFIVNGLVIACMLLAFYCLNLYLKKNGRKFAWWKWVLSAIWLVFTYISVAFIGTAIGENEPGAAMRGGGAFLAIAVVIGIVLFRFVILNKDKKQSA